MTRRARDTVVLALAVLTVLGTVAAARPNDDVRLAQRGGGRRTGRGGGGEVPVDARALVRGSVTAVDQGTGRVTLEVDGATLEATFPASVAVDLHPGHVVYVTLNVIDTRLATVRGSVASVDLQKGTLTVTTARGPITVSALPERLREMHPGDEVLLRLDVIDIGAPGGGEAPAPGPAR